MIFCNFADMRHCLIALFALLLVACHDDVEPAATPLKRVVVVYMMAENSLSSFASNDLAEIRRRYKAIPDSCRLVVYLDNSQSDQKPTLISFDPKYGETVFYKYKVDPISTDSAAMQQVLSTIMQRQPARNYGLVMWSHGSGWIPQQNAVMKRPQRTIGVDNGENTTQNKGTEMEITTLANVLKQTGVRWDYVFFDACFMQCAEVAYELRDAAAWCIGSPAEIPCDGAPYDVIMPNLFADVDSAWTIARDYFGYYRYREGLVISAARLSEMEALAEATRPLMAQLDPYPAVDGIQRYNPANTKRKPEYYDLGSAIAKWHSADDYALWRQAMEQAVPFRYATSNWYSYMNGYGEYPPVIDPDHIACLSTYIPVEGRSLNDYYSQTAWWKKLRE